MNYNLIKDILNLLQQFELESFNKDSYSKDVEGFKKWIIESFQNDHSKKEPNWEGKENGRSAESVINTFVSHMNRYAKSYSKSAILGSDFSNQEDFIYLINLKALGPMSKMDLIRKNVHEKPSGIQIINRLIRQDWVGQTDSKTDKRSKVIFINSKGLQVLEKQMDKIRQATQIVTGNLRHCEKMELIMLLSKMNDFHQTIYNKNIEPEDLLDVAIKRINFN